MKKSLMNNFTLRIISVIIAFFIWFFVMTIEDPVMVQKISDVPVTLVNEDYIKSTNKVAMMPERGNTITVYVTGKTSVVGKLRADDITAIADLRQIVDMDSNPIMVPVTATCAGISEDKISTSSNNIEIMIDDLDSLECIVVPTNGETKPGKGYAVGKMTCNPERITVRGPHSIVKTIDKIAANVNVNGLIEDTNLPASLVIYDKNGDVLTENQMKALTLSATDLYVDVDLWEMRTDITLVPNHSGEPGDGYQVGTITLTPATVSIAGTDEALREFEETGNTIQLEESMISVENKYTDFEITIARDDVIKLLPEGIKLVSDNETFSVKVTILPLKTKEYVIPTTNIVINNKDADLDLVFASEEITLRVRGRDEIVFKAFKVSDISMGVDVSGLGEGEHEVPLTIVLPEGFKLVDDMTVQVTLTRIAELTKNTN